MYGGEVFGGVNPLVTLNLVQEDLFPFAKEQNVNTSAYINLILNHTRVNDEDKMFIRNGVQWLNEEAVSLYRRSYNTLGSKQRLEVLEKISKERWGESWIETILTYIMEAMFSDRLYGVNPNEAGQKWLSFSNGLPRPTKALL